MCYKGDHKVDMVRTFKFLDELIRKGSSGKRRELLSSALRNCRQKVSGYPYFPPVEITKAVYMQFDNDMKKVLPLLAACSALHLGADLNDDFADNDLPPYWKVIDKGIITLLSYDIFYNLRNEALDMLGGYPVRKSVITSIKRTFDEAAICMIAGQYADISHGVNASIEDAMDSVAGKSGMQIWAFCKVASLLGGATKSQAEKMSLFGKNIAIAAQVATDCNDIWGRGASSDLRNGRVTVPVAYALSVRGAQKHLRRLLARYKKNPYIKTLREIRGILADSGALFYTALKVQTHINLARVFLMGALGRIPPSFNRIFGLAGLIDYGGTNKL